MEEKIKPTKWIAFYPGIYAELRHTGTVGEKAAVFDDIVDSVLKDKEPEYAINSLMLKRSSEFFPTRRKANA